MGLLRHHVVDRRRVAEVGAPLDIVRRPDAVDEVDGCRPRPANLVMHVQLQVHRLLVAGRAGEQESYDGDGDELLCGGPGGHYCAWDSASCW